MKFKKIGIILLSSLFLAACGDEKESEATKEGQSSNGSVNVEKGLLNVEVTLPAGFFEGRTEEEIVADAEEGGVSETVVNEDGSVTYTMSRSKHKEMMQKMEDNMVKMVKEVVESGDYPSIKEISYNKDFDEFDVKVDREAYENSLDGFAILGIVMGSSYYGAFNGVSSEEMKITFNLVDVNTDEVFETSVYPDDLKEGTETK